MTIYDHQKNAMRYVFGDQADDVIAWVDEHLTVPADVHERTPVVVKGDDGVTAPVGVLDLGTLALGTDGDTITATVCGSDSPWIDSAEIWDRCKEDPPEARDRVLNEWASSGREVPVRVFMQAGEDPLHQVGETTVTDPVNHHRQVAEFLRALADEFDRPGT